MRHSPSLVYVYPPSRITGEERDLLSMDTEEVLDGIEEKLEAATIRTFLHRHPERELTVYESASQMLRNLKPSDRTSERRRLALLSRSMLLLDEALCVGREQADTTRIEEALDLAGKSGDEVQQARALVAYAIRLVNIGESRSADGKLVKVLLLAESYPGNQEMMSMEGRALLARGHILVDQTKLEPAEVLLRDALSTLERTNDRVGISMTYDLLARVLLATDKAMESDRFARMGEEIKRQMELEYPV